MSLDWAKDSLPRRRQSVKDHWGIAWDRQIALLEDVGAGCLDFGDGFMGVHGWVDVTRAVETQLTKCLEEPSGLWAASIDVVRWLKGVRRRKGVRCVRTCSVIAVMLLWLCLTLHLEGYRETDGESCLARMVCGRLAVDDASLIFKTVGNS